MALCQSWCHKHLLLLLFLTDGLSSRLELGAQVNYRVPPLDGARNGAQVNYRVPPLDGARNGAQVEVEYVAAVLEYQPYGSWVSGGHAILQENARIYLEYAALARDQSADIIVFPEYGLTSTDVAGGDILTLSQLIPNPADLLVPCDFPAVDSYTEVVKDLSCGARELELYLVVNLIEQEPCNPTTTTNPTSSTHPKTSQEQLSSLEDTVDSKVEVDRKASQCPSVGHILYNTQVVFDRAGAVVARYRKKHLFLEPKFTPGTEDDTSALFTTDFGVTFTLQVCFDIMFRSPGVSNVEAQGVGDVVMSTAWIDELPFLTAPQVFSGWSRGLGVNLLVANYHDPLTGKLGSGIFRGATSQESLYSYDHLGGTTLLVGPVLTMGTRPKGQQSRLQPSTGRSLQEDINGSVKRKGGKSRTLQKNHQSRINSITDHNLLEDINGTLKLKGGKSRTLQKDIDEDRGSKDPEGVPQHRRMKPRSYRHDTTSGDNLTNAHNSTSGQMKDKSDFFFIHENLDRYNRTVLERPDKVMTFTKTLCYNESFCCTVTYSYLDKGTEEGLYMLLVYSGLVTKGGGVYSMYTQVCSVVYCLNENITSCANLINGEMNLTTEETNLTSEKANLTNEEATLTKEETLPTTFRPYELYGVFNTPYVYPSVFTQQLTLANDSLWRFFNTGKSEMVNGSCMFIEEHHEGYTCCIEEHHEGYTCCIEEHHEGYTCCESMSDPRASSLLSLTMFGRWYDYDPHI